MSSPDPILSAELGFGAFTMKRARRLFAKVPRAAAGGEHATFRPWARERLRGESLRGKLRIIVGNQPPLRAGVIGDGR